MNQKDEIPYTLQRDPADLIVFVNWMHRRHAYHCTCGTVWSGLYKSVYCCPQCGREVLYDDKRD